MNVSSIDSGSQNNKVPQDNALQNGKDWTFIVQTSPDLTSKTSNFKTSTDYQIYENHFFRSLDDQFEKKERAFSHSPLIDPNCSGFIRKVDVLRSSITTPSPNENNVDQEFPSLEEQRRHITDEITNEREKSVEGTDDLEIESLTSTELEEGENLLFEEEDFELGNTDAEKQQSTDAIFDGTHVTEEGISVEQEKLEQREAISAGFIKVLDAKMESDGIEHKDHRIIKTKLEKKLDQNDTPTEQEWYKMYQKVLFSEFRAGNFTLNGHVLSEEEFRKFLKDIKEDMRAYYRSDIAPLLQPKHEQEPKTKKSPGDSPRGDLPKKDLQHTKLTEIRKRQEFETSTKDSNVRIYKDLIESNREKYSKDQAARKTQEEDIDKQEEILRKDQKQTRIKADDRSSETKKRVSEDQNLKKAETTKQIEKTQIGRGIKEKIKSSNDPDTPPIDVIDYTKEKRPS